MIAWKNESASNVYDLASQIPGNALARVFDEPCRGSTGGTFEGNMS